MLILIVVVAYVLTSLIIAQVFLWTNFAECRTLLWVFKRMETVYISLVLVWPIVVVVWLLWKLTALIDGFLRKFN